MTQFNKLLHDCGLSTRGAAYLLGVRYDTVRNWKYDKCAVPDGVMNDLKRYARAAHEIFTT